MKVAFDASSLAFKQKTGTGVYCEELMTSYEKRFEGDQVFHTYRLSRRIRGREYLLPLGPHSSRDTILDPLTYFKGFKYDIFHGLNSRLPLITHAKKIATIHDLFSLFGEFSKAEFKEDQARKLKAMIGRADHIIVPASFTRDQLVNDLKVSAQKVSVVTEGVRDLFLGSIEREKNQKFVAEKFGLTRPYLLFVGTLEKRKNVLGLVKAFCRLQAQNPQDLDLVLVGHPGFQYDEIKKEIENAPVREKIKVMGFVNEGGLCALYQACDAFILLSLEEGFGIPVIEAMACGVPVITSNTTSLPEVGGGYTWLVSPHDVDQAAKTFLEVVKGSPLTRDRVASGTKHARALTWTRVAELTRDVYVKVTKKTKA